LGPTTTSVTTTTVSGNWWSKLGTPQYGGIITERYNANPASFDPFQGEGFVTVQELYLSRLFADQWTLDPAQWDYSKVSWRPDQVTGGDLAKSWEFSDPTTFVVHLRQGMHWQNIAPANGREVVADDIVYNHNRLYGLGGMPGSPTQMTNSAYKKLISVTATDKYTVVFKWTIPNPTFILSTLEATGGAAVDMVCPDAVKQWGDVTDWHHAIGSGPFILQDFVSGSSATLVKNNDYFGYDDRYPQNKLPYVDGIKILVIPDDSTALAALRTGKIDLMGNLSATQANDLKKTNPELVNSPTPFASTPSVDPKYGVKPFSDINVRIAMQKAIDLKTIAANYYAGQASADPSTLTSNDMGMGWGYPYSGWAQSLKDSYAYDPVAAKKLLADAGYPNGFKTDIVFDSSGDSGLIQIVQSYFAAVGITMDIKPLDAASWITYVQVGHNQDQLSMKNSGYVGITFDVDRQLQRFLGPTNTPMFNDPVFNDLYAQSLAATSVDTYKAVFAKANQYVAEQHYIICLVKPMVNNFCQPWLKGFMAQDNAGQGASGGRLNGFYGARFWIDQKVKSAAGH
jgi:peptide/nickel transport system substrate-binding protein